MDLEWHTSGSEWHPSPPPSPYSEMDGRPGVRRCSGSRVSCRCTGQPGCGSANTTQSHHSADPSETAVTHLWASGSGQGLHQESRVMLAGRISPSLYYTYIFISTLIVILCVSYFCYNNICIMLVTEENFTTLSSTEATLTDVLSQMVLK